MRWKNIIPEIGGGASYPLEPFSWELLKSRGIEVLFLATPHELSRELVPEALAHGLRIVDLSGAWRLKQAANRAVYGFEDQNAGGWRRSWTGRRFTDCRRCIAKRFAEHSWWRIRAAMRLR